MAIPSNVFREATAAEKQRALEDAKFFAEANRISALSYAREEGYQEGLQRAKELNEILKQLAEKDALISKLQAELEAKLNNIIP